MGYFFTSKTSIVPPPPILHKKFCFSARLLLAWGLVLAGLVLSQCSGGGSDSGSDSGGDSGGGGGGDSVGGGGGGSSSGSGGDPIIAAGSIHTCALHGVQSQVLCWGSDGSKQLGNGAITTIDQPSPMAVLNVGGAANSTLTGVTTIAAGKVHTCALQGGQALCWGADDKGQLGNGATTTADQPSPVNVRAADGAAGNLTGVMAIAAGDAHTCALQGGQALCWGSGRGGQLGNGAFSKSPPSPVAVLDVDGVAGSTLTGVTAITAGQSHTCALQGGQALCWGFGVWGRLGDGANAPSARPVKVLAVGQSMGGTALTGVMVITAGDSHTCALQGDQALCWGNGRSGQLGNGANGPTASEDSPVAVRAVGGAAGSTLTGVMAITAGVSHTCALQGSQAMCWGVVVGGRLGNGATTNNQLSPVNVLAVGQSMGGTALTGVTVITAGRFHTCALQGSQSQMLCWGSNGSRQLGNGATNASSQYSPGNVNMVQ